MKHPHHGWGGGQKGSLPGVKTRAKPGGKPPATGRGKPPHKGPVPPKKPPPPVKPKPHKKPRQLSPGWDVACCSAQAVGTLLGWDWEQVLALYWRTASGPDMGATILETLVAAQSWNGGVTNDVSTTIKPRPRPIAASTTRSDRNTSTGLILGVTLPEPHAIAVTPDGTWWSWGQPFNPAAWPDLVIEEAWCLP